jgi:hypothetical protein
VDHGRANAFARVGPEMTALKPAAGMRTRDTWNGATAVAAALEKRKGG